MDRRICNFGGGVKNSCSLAQLSEWCEKRFGARKVESDPKPRPYDLPWVVLDSTRAKEVWGWEVRTPLSNQLSTTELATRHDTKHENPPMSDID